MIHQRNIIIDKVSEKAALKKLKSGKPVLIYGATTLCLDIHEYLKKNDIHVDAFFISDGHAYDVNNAVENVITLSEAASRYNSFYVVIGRKDVVPAIKHLKTTVAEKMIDFFYFNSMPFSEEKRRFKKPLYIEFIGVPGVGKTYIYNKLLKKQRDWIDKRLFNYRLARDLTHPFYEKLARLKIERISNSTHTAIDKLRFLSYFEQILLQDYVIKKQNEQYIVSADEGILHNFTDVLNAMINEEKSKELDWFLSNRITVFCYGTPELVADRILKRYEETGNLLPQHKSKSRQALVNDQRIELEKKKNFVKNLENSGVEVIHVDTSVSSSINADKIIACTAEWMSVNRV